MQIPPMCRTPRGCPIEDVAADWALNKDCERFIRAKVLYDTNEISGLLEAEYKAMGLLDDLEALYELERIWAEFRNNQQKGRIKS